MIGYDRFVSRTESPFTVIVFARVSIVFDKIIQSHVVHLGRTLGVNVLDQVVFVYVCAVWIFLAHLFQIRMTLDPPLSFASFLRKAKTSFTIFVEASLHAVTAMSFLSR